MKEKRTGRASAAKTETDWRQLRARSERDTRRGIQSDPDTEPTDAGFWSRAHVVLPGKKQTITIRLDSDLLGWLRQEKGYQTRINAVLRTYMLARIGRAS
jgi:uncharacterized protein (DUF4415 family)